MTNLSKYAVIALLTASPMAVLADTPMSGSPQQSIDADPNEYADDGTVLKNSLEGARPVDRRRSVRDSAGHVRGRGRLHGGDRVRLAPAIGRRGPERVR